VTIIVIVIKVNLRDVIVGIVVSVRRLCHVDNISSSTSTSAAYVEVVVGESHPHVLRRLAFADGRFGHGSTSDANDNFVRRPRLERQEDLGWDELVEDAAITEARRSDDGLYDADENRDKQETDRGVQHVQEHRAVERDVVERGVGKHHAGD